MSTKNEEIKAFLDGLKPGDTVDQIVRGTWGPPRIEQMTVAKRTATQIVMTCGTRFREYDGSVVGRSIYGSLRCPPTAEQVQEVNDQNEQRGLASSINDTLWRHVTLDKLRRIKAILEEKQDD